MTGDCLQLYGLFGSQDWGVSILYPREHLAALSALSELKIENLDTAHDFHPYGYAYEGREAVLRAIDACREAILEIRDLYLAHPGATDAEIRAIYNALDRRPPVRVQVFAAVRIALPHLQ